MGEGSKNEFWKVTFVFSDLHSKFRFQNVLVDVELKGVSDSVAVGEMRERRFQELEAIESFDFAGTFPITNDVLVCCRIVQDQIDAPSNGQFLGIDDQFRSPDNKVFSNNGLVIKFDKKLKLL